MTKVETPPAEIWNDPAHVKGYTDLALTQVGMPVKCRTCRVQGFVKPHDYGGWWRWKFVRGTSRWYCPEDAPKGQSAKDYMDTSYPTPEPEKPAVDAKTEEELYKLLD